MTRSPSLSASRPDSGSERERIRTRACALLDHDERRADPGDERAEAAIATQLMDLYRRTGDREAFDCLVRWVAPQLAARIRSRLRGLGARFDAQEILQDTIVNIYRYPDRFLASRPGAFAAWSSTIVDNAIRRQLRQRRQGPDVVLRAPEVLQEQADHDVRDPSQAIEEREQCREVSAAFALLLQCYLTAFQTLGERERFVLQMVEIRGMRYAELAAVLAIRPEALKMIVFRARKRLFERAGGLLHPEAPVPSPGGRRPMRSLLSSV